MPGTCPVCEGQAELLQSIESYKIECPRCGAYTVSDWTKDKIEAALTLNEIGIQEHRRMVSPSRDDLYIEVAKKCIGYSTVVPRSIISHAIRKRKTGGNITASELAAVVKNNSLQKPIEQANNLIMFLGDRLVSVGDYFEVQEQDALQNAENIYGLLGLRLGLELTDLRAIIISLKEQNLLNVKYWSEGDYRLAESPQSVSLTLLGWQKYEDLKRSVKDSRKAFVAMAFVDPNKDKDDYYFFQKQLLDQNLVPAVEKVGYELSNPTASNPEAGNLHARMEVLLRSARFVVAELSHHNNGAYWEAGFAKALGKPVIYMFNREIGGQDKPHFDVGSDYIIFWEKDKPEAAAEELQAVIGATLFGEAIPLGE
jgi:hypothetical protein